MLSTRYDPEDLRELIGPYHRCVAETVGRFDGFVAKYMGDGVLIYFGYPQAHEDACIETQELVGKTPSSQKNLPTPRLSWRPRSWHGVSPAKGRAATFER